MGARLGGGIESKDLAWCFGATKENLVKVGLHPEGLIVHQDQDTVYTSYDWLRTLLIEDGVVVYSGAWSEGQPVDGVVLGAREGRTPPSFWRQPPWRSSGG